MNCLFALNSQYTNGMNVVIIEDEVQTAWDIRNTIEKVRPGYSVVAMLDHVESGIEWFQKNAKPDLIISDIRLGDGLSFDIFRNVPLPCPIIFCTAYDEYAMEAFKNNGVDYLLKPVNDLMLDRSLKKVEGFVNSTKETINMKLLESLRHSLENKELRYRRSFLVSYRSQLIPIQTDQIALFNIENKDVFLYTHEGKRYPIPDTLEQLETMLPSEHFFRANRQYIVAFRAIRHIEHFDARKLLVETGLNGLDSLVVSKAKASEFLSWVESH